MRILRADFENFRNFEQATLEPSEHFTILLGENGQGKTNALEGIYLSSALRPLRSVPRRALIRHGAPQAILRLSVLSASTGLVHELEVQLKGSSRHLQRDGKKVAASEYLGTLVCVSFTPDDLQLAKAGPDLRRRFLDRALLNAQPAYLNRALRYAKSMKDRNRLLATLAPGDQLAAFDEILVKEGSAIVRARQAYVERMAPKVADRFQAIAGPAPRLDVSYRSSLPHSGEPIEERFLRALQDCRERDRRRGTTSVGPHLDDLELAFEGTSFRERASQGQHRAFLLALKLVEIEELAEDLREPPVLLLDDMSSELDPRRTAQLFDAVRALDGQVILTSTTVPELFRSRWKGEQALIQHVHTGKLSPPSRFPSEEIPEEPKPPESS